MVLIKSQVTSKGMYIIQGIILGNVKMRRFFFALGITVHALCICSYEKNI